MSSEGATIAVASPSGSVRVTARWMARGAWAVLDQGLFALSNFGINIVMARWLTPRDYGAFTLAYSVFLLLGTVHSALLVEPMMVFGAGKYREQFSSYLALLMQGHWLVTAAASTGLAIIALALSAAGQPVVGTPVLALAAVSPFILLLWLVRRVCYMQNRPHLAASGGIFYMAVLMGGAYLLFRLGRLSSPAAFALMGVGSLASSLWIQSRLPPVVKGASRDFRRTVAAQHWEYGRWAVGSGALGSLVLNLYYFTMPAWHGLESTATLRALVNLMLPALNTFLALWVVVLPRLVSVRGTAGFNILIRRLLLVCCSAAIANWLALGWWHHDLARILYRGAYTSESHLLWILGLVPLGYAGSTVLENALRALERSDHVFRAYAVSLATTCVVGLPLTFVWGVGGAVVGLVIASALSVCSMTWSLRTRTGTGAQHA